MTFEHTSAPACIVAKSKENGKIIATRFGEIIKKDNQRYGISNMDPNMEFLASLPTFIPKKVRNVGNFSKLQEKLPYGKYLAFEEIKEADTLYFCHLLCVGREARGKGLGLELIKRGHKLAIQGGCSDTFVMATGMFSQRIFQKLGYTVLHEVKYADCEKDHKGRPFLNDYGDHKVLQIVALKH